MTGPTTTRPSAARRLARRAYAPIERFLAIEAASGVLLLAAAAVALLWANSPWRESYSALWHVAIGPRDLHFWINDGVMTIFFFVVGLEIRREIHRGELSELRRATLPLAAALGGMLVPAAIFAVLNRGHASIAGWGVPMATDIAFAVGVLTLLGSRVPPALRVLLLALAVIDDVGAIVVIAIFYSSDLSATGFLVLGAGLAAIVGMRRLGVRNPWAYVPAGIVAWTGALISGIHPTLAGVVIGLMTPVLPELLPSGEEREAPVERIERALHGWVAFGAMPLFALANAGVSLGDAAFDGEPRLVLLGVVLGLVFGKPIGVLAFSWIAVRLRLAALPRGTTWSQIGLVGVVAGIGFTMSIFIAELAFPAGTNLETGKFGVLVASGVAGLLAYGLGLVILRARRPLVGAATESLAESSTAN